MSDMEMEAFNEELKIMQEVKAQLGAKVIIVAATTLTGAIGKDNDLIVKSKEDMQFFKDLTMNHVVIMGRKTFDSLPAPLEGRINVVVTRKAMEYNRCDVPGNVVFVDSLSDALALFSEEEKVFIIGGAEIYAKALESDVVDEMFITLFYTNISGDRYFPPLKQGRWKWSQVKESMESKVPFRIFKYEAKNQMVSPET